MEEVGKVGGERESLSDKCEVENKNCKDSEADADDKNMGQRLVELNKGY
jgi:hypothetical protein